MKTNRDSKLSPTGNVLLFSALSFFEDGSERLKTEALGYS